MDSGARSIENGADRSKPKPYGNCNLELVFVTNGPPGPGKAVEGSDLEERFSMSSLAPNGPEGLGEVCVPDCRRGTKRGVCDWLSGNFRDCLPPSI